MNRFIVLILNFYFFYTSSIGFASPEDPNELPGYVTIYVTENPDREGSVLLKLRDQNLEWSDFKINQPAVQGNIESPLRIFPSKICGYLGFYFDKESNHYVYPSPDHFFNLIKKLSQNRMEKVTGLISDLEFLQIISRNKMPLSDKALRKTKYQYKDWIHDITNHISIFVFPEEWIRFVALRAEKTIDLSNILSSLGARPEIIKLILKETAAQIDASQGTLNNGLLFQTTEGEAPRGLIQPYSLKLFFEYLTGVTFTDEEIMRVFRGGKTTFSVRSDLHFERLVRFIKFNYEEATENDLMLLHHAIQLLNQKWGQKNQELNFPLTRKGLFDLFNQEINRFHQDLSASVMLPLHQLEEESEISSRVQEHEEEYDHFTHEEMSWWDWVFSDLRRRIEVSPSFYGFPFYFTLILESNIQALQALSS